MNHTSSLSTRPRSLPWRLAAAGALLSASPSSRSEAPIAGAVPSPESAGLPGSLLHGQSAAIVDVRHHPDAALRIVERHQPGRPMPSVNFAVRLGLKPHGETDRGIPTDKQAADAATQAAQAELCDPCARDARVTPAYNRVHATSRANTGGVRQSTGIGFRALPALVLLFVAGCGGGGPATAPAPTPVAGTHTVSVTVSGLRSSYDGTTLRNNGGDDLRVYADGTYTFATPVANGNAYAVAVSAQPSGPAQTCTVANGSGTVSGSNVANVAVSCPFPTAYAVGGTVSGLAGSGLKLEYDADNVSLPATLSVAAAGSFVFNAATTSAITGTAYRLRIVTQPTGPAQTCILTGGSGTVAAADVSSVRVSCANRLVRIALTGMRDTGVITLVNNGVDVIGVGAHTGPYQFTAPVATGSPYNVTIRTQPTSPSQTCVVSNGSGTMGGSDVTVGIDCPYPPAYSVGGTIAGLAGATGTVSVLYGADNLNFFIDHLFSNGSFAFTAAEVSPVAGTVYSVTIWSQPVGQRCDVVGGSGTVGAGDVTSIRITCVPASVVSTCTPPVGAGTTHGSVSAPETWTEAGSPHILPFDTSIYAAVTIEPCAVVRIARRATVTVNPGGSLVAQGQPARPVTFEPIVAGQAWASIRNLGGTLSLSHAVLTGGGEPLATHVALAGALQMQSPLATGGILHVDNVEIVGSLSQGVYVNGPIGFDASSRNLIVRGSVSFPVHVYARVIGSIPTGTYTGNGRDAIAISGTGGAVVDAQTMRARGVPYHVGSTGQDGGRMDVDSQVAGQVAVLTIEPGVTIQFPPGGIFNVGPGFGTAAARGALIAIGGTDPADRIVFTSDKGAASQAGDWLGVTFGGAVDTRSVMQNVRVEFAGGTSTTGSNSCPYPGGTGINAAAIRIFGTPLAQFITGTEIRSSLANGIDRGWRSDLQPDFLAGNTFTAVAACKQTLPRTAAGVCPLVLPCP